MPGFAEVVFNPKRIVVAAFNPNTLVIGTPVEIQYPGTFSFDATHDVDEIMSAGMIVEKLSIKKSYDGKISATKLNLGAMLILTGNTPASYGTTPNRYDILDDTMGGNGFPFFSVIAEYASTGGGNVLVGFIKCILNKDLAFEVDQNKFKLGEAEFTAMSASPGGTNKGRRIKVNETAETIPTTQSPFQAFFSGMT